MALPISCFIIALNEADRIGATIRSVRHWVDEVIVVDSGSTDGTIALAEAEGARVIHNAWPGFGQQKRFAEDQCRNSWLLNLDADEVVTPELAAEIEALFRAGEPTPAAYGMQVSIVYPGWHRPRIWGRDHYCLRLYDRRRVRFRDSTLHDSVVPGGEPVGHLRGVVHHHTMRSIAEFERKSDARATYQAQHMARKSPWGLRLRLLTELPASFLKYYVVRGHITGGWMGVRVAFIIAWYRWARIVRMHRHRRWSTGVGAVADQMGS
jgi:glycosyltransferase involved in cell wall biosynthesis